MIEFLDWWADSASRVVFALLILSGISWLIYDVTAMVTNTLKCKYLAKAKALDKDKVLDGERG